MTHQAYSHSGLLDLQAGGTLLLQNFANHLQLYTALAS